MLGVLVGRVSGPAVEGPTDIFQPSIRLKNGENRGPGIYAGRAARTAALGFHAKQESGA